MPLPYLPKKKKKKGSKKIGESPQVDPLDTPHVEIPSLPQAAENREEQNQAEERTRHEHAREREIKDNVVEVPVTVTESEALNEKNENVVSLDEKTEQEEVPNTNEAQPDNNKEMETSAKSDNNLFEKKEEGQEVNLSSSVKSGNLVNSRLKETESCQIKELSKRYL